MKSLKGRTVRITQTEVEAAVDLSELLAAKGLILRPVIGGHPIEFGERGSSQIAAALAGRIAWEYDIEHAVLTIRQELA